VLARLFLVLLLAISLSSVRGWTMLETTSPLEVVGVDTQPVVQESEATVNRPLAAADRRSTEIARVIPGVESAASSPDLGRVFRPPRLLGS